ncbi:MAG: hypothetical protein GVY08_14080 [Bacteroidetes bacterium]|nr:hypothetical protein [Bacteroidota bacterium]
MKKHLSVAIFIICVMTSGCTFLEGDHSRNKGPGEFVDLSEPDRVKNIRTLQFEREQVFEDSLLLDRIPDITIDDEGTLYLAGEKWNHRHIHHFSAIGTYRGILSDRQKNGPEFDQISSLHFRNDQLWILDSANETITRYGPDEETDLDYIALDSLLSEELTAGQPNNALDLHPLGVDRNGRLLFAFHEERNPAYQPDGQMHIALLSISDGVGPKILFQEKAERYIVGVYAGKPAPFTLPIAEKPFIEFTDTGKIVSAHSTDFSIRIFSTDGAPLRTYRYPLQRVDFQPEEDLLPEYTHNRQLHMVRESAKYPDHWPALYDMFVDDEENIWISTVQVDRDVSEWFVIDDIEKSVAARFHWPVDKPFRAVKGGKAYTIEQNSSGFEVVVRYDVAGLVD